MQRGWRFALPLPDAVLALVFFGAAVYAPFTHAVGDSLFYALVAEGGFLMAQGTLVDIATRLRKRPPVWAAALIVIGVMVFSQFSLDVLKLAWERGSLVFLPLLVSIAERGTILWRMPGRPRIEKVAARALISNRIATGIGLLGLTVAALIASMTIPGFPAVMSDMRFPMLAGALYFAIAAFDDWRVRGRRFAEKPRVLFGFDVIHIEYLDPV